MAENHDQSGSVRSLLLAASAGRQRSDTAELADLAEAMSRVASDTAVDFGDERVLLESVYMAVDEARYWQEPSNIDNVLDVGLVRRSLERIERAVTESAIPGWLSGAMDGDNQRLVQWWDDSLGWGGRSADTDMTRPLVGWRDSIIEEERRAASDRPADPSASWSGHWWSSPVTGGCLSSTRAAAGLPALGVDLTEDSMGATRARVTAVQIAKDARIFEIRSGEDWLELVDRSALEVTASRRHDRYRTTGRVGSWHIPDWESLARDYDGVHLSVMGYLGTAGMVLDLPELGSATLLAGWDPDETFWLKSHAAHAVTSGVEIVQHGGEWGAP